jgi:hypothetical protein
VKRMSYTESRARYADVLVPSADRTGGLITFGTDDLTAATAAVERVTPFVDDGLLTSYWLKEGTSGETRKGHPEKPSSGLGCGEGIPRRRSRRRWLRWVRAARRSA